MSERAIRLTEVLQVLARQAQDSMDRQIVESGDSRGGVVRPDWGIAEPTGTCGLVATCGLLAITQRLHPDSCPTAPKHADLLSRAAMGLDYILRTQRPSGRMDLRDCNYDSAPDAAFAVQTLYPVWELGSALPDPTDEWTSLLEALRLFLRRATQGMLDGGFHTPNHRWVMAAAMAETRSLFPDMPVDDVIGAYLAEGIDIDADGAYTERSAGVYDAICDRSMMLLWEYLGCEEALDAACRNLNLNLHLLHPDGTIETGASRRQDLSSRPVPSALALPYLMAHRARPNPRFLRAAEFLWERSHGDAAGLTWYLLRHGGPDARDETGFPFDFAAAFPAIGLYRWRRGEVSATGFRDSTRLFTLVFGQGELAAVRISQSYFGAGRFVGDELRECEGGCILESHGRHILHRPGYDLPLGRPADPARWFETRGERDWRELPPCASELTIVQNADGFELIYRTTDGLPGVTAQIALDFVPGGVWETSDTCLRPHAGQTLFLKQGYGVMRYGLDAIEIGPGAHAHRMWAMRDAETAPGHVRVLLTFETPVNHRLVLRCRHTAGTVLTPAYSG